MTSTSGISNPSWGVQQHKFITDVRVLPLNCYDMIVGMDWLEACGQGKMWIDWRLKTMRFWHEGKRITLRGVKNNTTHCPKISTKELNFMVQQGAVAQIIQLDRNKETTSVTKPPKNIQNVLAQYADTFQEPTQLPASRPFDHSIPLIPGAVPVQKKPYRYTPA